jgi:hypothetical protein
MAMIVENMFNKRPVIIGSLRHAMVCVAADYDVDIESGRETVTAINVFDPWPDNPRLRDLNDAELRGVNLVMGVVVRDGPYPGG